MHYLIEFAHVGSDGCAQALAGLQLPHLNQLLQRMVLLSTDAADEYTLSPPHERALAQHCGLWTGDGKTPWAARELSTPQPSYGYQAGQAWAHITPCFWHVGVDQIQMLHPDGLQLSEVDSRTVLEAVRPYFAEDGIALHYHSPTCWYAHSPLFDGLATASLDRVVGRNVNAWMPEGAQAAPLRRLQNEMQMLLYTHPVNDARQAAGQLAVNSFWVSGAGALPHGITPHPGEMTVLSNLRTPALHEDWAQWAAQWQQLDSTVLKDVYAQMQRGQSVSLTLCGEKAAQHWISQKPSIKSFFTNLLPSQSKHLLLKQL
jgi:hypothetical protein